MFSSWTNSTVLCWRKRLITHRLFATKLDPSHSWAWTSAVFLTIRVAVSQLNAHVLIVRNTVAIAPLPRITDLCLRAGQAGKYSRVACYFHQTLLAYCNAMSFKHCHNKMMAMTLYTPRSNPSLWRRRNKLLGVNLQTRFTACPIRLGSDLVNDLLGQGQN